MHLLSNGVQLPDIALGTGRFPDVMRNELAWLLPESAKLGWRIIDTSDSYKNEDQIGEVLLTCIPRPVIQTKISNRQQKKKGVRRSISSALSKLKSEHVDAYLMHWPYPGKYLDTWKGMEVAYAKGQCKAIGVCNCHVHHLKPLMEACGIPPMINQIELHPLLQQRETVEYCQRRGILIEAYSPLAKGSSLLLKNPVIVGIAKARNKTPAQVALRWSVQHGCLPIVKTESPDRLRENIQLDFELSRLEMKMIDGLDCGHRVGYDPDTCDMDKL